MTTITEPTRIHFLVQDRRTTTNVDEYDQVKYANLEQLKSMLNRVPEISECGTTGVDIHPEFADAWLSVGPTGTGFLTATTPDGTTGGGICRGINAVDWQIARDDPVQVAQGDFSVIDGGKNNIAIANYSTILGGKDNQITEWATFSIAGGYNNTILSGVTGSTGGGTMVVGLCNTVQSYAGMVTGQKNLIYSDRVIVGGFCNIVGSSIDTARGSESIVSGRCNNVQGYRSIVVGEGNTVNYSSYRCAIFGINNSASFGGRQSLINGSNNESANANVMLNGVNNFSSSVNSFVSGSGNSSFTTADNTAIVGGSCNKIGAGDSEYATILGGKGNYVNGNGTSSSVIGSFRSTVTNSSRSAIIASYGLTGSSRIEDYSNQCLIGAAYSSKIDKSDQSAIVGGKYNLIQATGATAVSNCSIISGVCNIISTETSTVRSAPDCGTGPVTLYGDGMTRNSVILGGSRNVAIHSNSVVLGEDYRTHENNSLNIGGKCWLKNVPQVAAITDCGLSATSDVVNLSSVTSICGSLGAVIKPSESGATFMTIGPSGPTGFISATTPDGTVDGGNCRGRSAVDWQIKRGAATEVASGDYSTIVGGANCVASGDFSLAAIGGTASGLNSISIGRESSATMTNSIAIGTNAYCGATGGIVIGHGAYSNGETSLNLPSSLAQVLSGTTVIFDPTTGQMGPSTSTQRFKQNIRDLEEELVENFMDNARSRRFEWIKSEQTDIGLIAEEVIELVPEVVPIDKTGRPMSINYDRLVTVLVKAIQKLRNELGLLKEKEIDRQKKEKERDKLILDLLARVQTLEQERS